ncbi:neurturin-like [Hippocampus zosterae]|uniref:neurturin-like n=1 Tax=Hippocampus zosterae TaxID=109293 RepID=UPI00223DD040|nr:neurturin-like [Hippocampus zosterae]XP_051943748.1 neurturin-like [Hippocampus zosterae]
MKLWKSATLALVLCGAALSLILLRNMAASAGRRPKARSKQQASSFSWRRPSFSATPSSSPAAALAGALQRRTRSADMNSLLSELSMMFQSFTKGELQHAVGTLLDVKREKKRHPGQTRRTKRARRAKPCSVRELELTVSELGLGYDSDETVMLRYCSGKCAAHRRNYDVAMEHMMRTGFRKKERKDKVSVGPCCRPTAFEKDFSFLDNRSRYHTIRNISAKNCGCV